MARVVNVEKLDRGFVVQTVVPEGAPAGFEGMSVALTAEEALVLVAKSLGIEVAQAAAPAAAPVKSEGAPIPMTPAAAPAEAIPSSEEVYEAELARLVTDNDRKAAHARLSAHVTNNIIEGYNPRLGAKALVDLIRAADKHQDQIQNGDPVVPVAQLPSGAALPEGVPAPNTGFDPLAAGEVITLSDVSAAMSTAAQQGDDQRGQVMQILHTRGVAKVSDIPEAHWGAVIAEAQAIK